MLCKSAEGCCENDAAATPVLPSALQQAARISSARGLAGLSVGNVRHSKHLSLSLCRQTSTQRASQTHVHSIFSSLFFTPHYHPPTTTITPLTPLRLSTTPAHPACPPGRPLRALCSTLVSVARNEWRNGPPPPRGIPASGAITEPAGKTMSFHSLPRETTRLQSLREHFSVSYPQANNLQSMAGGDVQR